jgi:hypothetical protein
MLPSCSVQLATKAGAAAWARDIHISPSADQHLDHLLPAVDDSQVQRRSSPVVVHVHVEAAPEQEPRGFVVPLLRHNVQQRLARVVRHAQARRPLDKQRKNLDVARPRRLEKR